MASTEDISAMRKPYKGQQDVFDMGDLVSKEPFKNFENWFKVACETPGILEANAMTLATATKDGKPSARMVLLKGYDKSGFKFFTNYGSRKANELDHNPFATIMFYWEPLLKMVRIEGSVERLSEEDSTNYFQSRPKASQIGAWCSQQSSSIEGRHILDNKKEELEKQYAETEVLPKPDFWGGYIIKPERFEFWQGQTNRLHDRIIFRKHVPSESIDKKLTEEGEEGWLIERLAP